MITSTTDAKSARQLLGFIEEFRKLNDKMQAQQIVTFLHIMAKPGISVTELAKATAMSSSAASRNAAALGETHRSGEKGFGLVDYNLDPNDTRVKRFYLTNRGTAVAKTLVQLLGA